MSMRKYGTEGEPFRVDAEDPQGVSEATLRRLAGLDDQSDPEAPDDGLDPHKPGWRREREGRFISPEGP